MKKLLTLFAGCLLFAACTSSDYDEPPRARGRGASGDGDVYGPARSDSAAGGLNIVPFNDWWHEPSIANPLNLSNDQFTSLDKIANDHRDDIARLARDSGTAMRDLRQTLDSNQPAVADITNAAQRVRALRDTLFDRQADMLAAERAVLTQTQWQTLQQQLRAERSDRGYGNRYPGRGRGGMGGRGRWPGF